MQKFSRKPQTVKAIQFDGTGDSFVDGISEESGRYHYQGTFEKFLLSRGQWIVIDEYGMKTVWGNDAFKNTFKPEE